MERLLLLIIHVLVLDIYIYFYSLTTKFKSSICSIVAVVVVSLLLLVNWGVSFSDLNCKIRIMVSFVNESELFVYFSSSLIIVV